MRSFIIKPGDLIPIGRAGENQATQIRFDVAGWADTFGAGTYTLVVKRPHEDTAYPVEVTTDGDYVVWTVSNVDTGIAGNASVQLRYVVDGALAKSVIYNGIVGESLDNIVDPPDPFEDLIQRMVDLAERTEAAAESAAGSAASASESAGTATAAKTAAQIAAQTAQTAQGTATQAAQTATQASTAAQTAQQAAEAAQSNAANSATAASGSATAAAGSATQAAASATAADASAAAAAQSAAAAQAAAMDVIDKAPIITDTASGAIASFPDGAAMPVKSVNITIEPVQAGTGDPSPTNVRPITGWTGANVVVSPTLDAQDGQTYPITWQSDAGTVYGGNLTVNEDGTGTLVVDRKLNTVTSFSGAWGATNNGYAVYNSTALGNRNISAGITISNLFVKSNAVFTSMPLGSYMGNSGASTTWTFILPSSITSLAEANAWLANLSSPLTVITKLATPLTYTLTAAEMTTLLGQNNWWADCGDIAEINYRCDTRKYIDKKLAALLAALS